MWNRGDEPVAKEDVRWAAVPQAPGRLLEMLRMRKS
jgi:hypothetical protein